MFAMHRQVSRVRAEGMLDSIQVQTVQHMRDQDRSSFLDGLIAAASGVVTEVKEQIEQVYIDRKPVGLKRLKQSLTSMLGAGKVGG